MIYGSRAKKLEPSTFISLSFWFDLYLHTIIIFSSANLDYFKPCRIKTCMCNIGDVEFEFNSNRPIVQFSFNSIVTLNNWNSLTCSTVHGVPFYTALEHRLRARTMAEVEIRSANIYINTHTHRRWGENYYCPRGPEDSESRRQVVIAKHNPLTA